MIKRFPSLSRREFFKCRVSSQFGDAKADQRARTIGTRAYPERQVVPLDLDALVSGGGLIHCLTQQEALPIA